MSYIDLKTGERFALNDIVYAVERRTPSGVQIVSVGDGSITTVTDDALRDAFFDGSLRRHLLPTQASPVRALNPPNHDFAAIPEKRRERAIARCHFVEALKAECGDLSMANDRLAQAVDRLRSLPGMPKHLSLSSVRRMIRTYKRSPGPLERGNVFANVPSRTGPAGRRIGHRVLVIIDEQLDRHWMVPHPDDLQQIYNDIAKIVAAENDAMAQSEQGSPASVPLRMPSLSTFYRLIRERDDKERIKKQVGTRAARNAYRPVLTTPEAHVPMGIIEIDHTSVDVIVVDANGLVIGHPTLSVAIDRHTRMIVGFALHWEGESYAAVMMALRHTIMPKTYLQAVFGDKIKNDWPAWGLPSTIVIDNGAAHHSSNLDAACTSLGNIAIDYTESKRPQHKAKIERLWRTLNRYLFHCLPGASLGRRRDSDYDPSKAARIQLQPLNLALHRIIVDFYNVRFHRGIGAVPLERWATSVAKKPLRLPAHISDLDVLSSGSETRSLTLQGIRIFDLRYNSLEIEIIRKKARRDVDVTVRYDPTDITAIQIKHPNTETYMTIPCLDEAVHGLSLWQWEAVKKRRTEKRVANNGSGIWDTRREIIDDLMASAEKHGRRHKTKRHAVRHHEPVTTPDKLALRDPTNLRDRPASDRPKPRKGRLSSADYRAMPDLPAAPQKHNGIPDLPADKGGGAFAPTPKQGVTVNAKPKTDSDDTGKPQAIPAYPLEPSTPVPEMDFEAFVAKNTFKARD